MARPMTEETDWDGLRALAQQVLGRAAALTSPPHMGGIRLAGVMGEAPHFGGVQETGPMLSHRISLPVR
jgi:hypothetical protein